MGNSKFKVKVAECPGCEHYIRFNNEPRLGQQVICPECDDRLEVRRLSPLRLDWAYDEHDPYDDWERDV